MRFRFPVAVLTLAAVLTACTDPTPPALTIRPPTTTTSTSAPPMTTTTIDTNVITLNMARVLIAVAKNAAAANERVTPERQPVQAAAAPSPVSSRRCPAGPIRDEIDRVFGAAAPWAESVVARESGCNPGARNGGSGSAGLFQLLGHGDLLRAACPTLDPSVSWSNADCNIRAAKFLYDAAGVSPWHL